MANGEESQLKSLFNAIRRKPATAPDRKTDEDAAFANGEKTSITHDLAHLGFKNAKTVADGMTTLASGEYVFPHLRLWKNIY